jgi:peptidoglycan/LPS O-acetylase OafA/YrhL
MTSFDPSRHPGHPGPSRRHLPGLDGIRGLAILMVMFSHFIVVGGNLKKGGILSTFLHSGYLGVDLFFVLSGFLITGILLDSKASKRYFSVFYIRRALRIFPVYYGLLAIAWLTVVFITPQDKAELTGVNSMAWSWLYASNIGMAVKGGWLDSPTWIGLGHFWSLAVEEQFYLVWPLVVYLLPERVLKWLCLALVVMSPLTFWLLSWWLGNLGTYVSTLSRVGVLAAGAGLAILWRHPAMWAWVQPKLVWVFAGFGALLLLERTILLKQLAFMEPSLALIVGAACVGMGASGAGGRWVSAFFQSRVLIWLGKYSYGIYVYHHALKPVWMRFFWDGWLLPQLGSGWPATFAYTGLATAASLLLAWISWKCFESPILSLKSRFNY